MTTNDLINSPSRLPFNRAYTTVLVGLQVILKIKLLHDPVLINTAETFFDEKGVYRLYF